MGASPEATTLSGVGRDKIDIDWVRRDELTVAACEIGHEGR